MPRIRLIERLNDQVARISVDGDVPLDHGFYASLKVPAFDDAVWACEHLHPNREEAHGCAVAEIQSKAAH